jgi:2-polyprenyl-3-methyl-5-hydroxy-6-metoxy-1,4-benzoquinol methylase
VNGPGFRYATELKAERYPWKEIPGSSHQILVERIHALPPGLRVLDLGFGAGFLARRIRARCSYLAGIELDPEAAREGVGYFDRPIVGDLLEELRNPWPEPFDVVVAGDVLEHVPDPEVPLAYIRKLVAPDGLLLVSLPNVANVTVRASLLIGRFPYRSRGILDATHLRFFTRRSARELLEKTSFRVERITPTAMPVELALPLLGKPWIAPLARGAAVAASRLLPTLFGYQFVFEARPS